MPRIPVARLHLNSMLTKQQFLLREKSASRTRQGTLMLRVTLADRTGSIPGVLFDVPGHVLDAIAVGRGVEVSGRVDEYRGQLQVNIERIAPVELSQLDEFLPTARRSHQVLTREFQALRASLDNPELATLLDAVFDQGTYDRFVRAPAAKYNHHACVGGLLEHTLDVARLVQTACDIYPELNRDLAIAVTILHDLGKIAAYDPVSFDLTEAGELWSHLYIGAAMVERAIDAMGGISEPLKMQLMHAILAHHGKLEHGSPVVPMTLEAIALSNADRYDADVRGALDHLERTEEDGGAFTGRSYMHETKLYRGPAEEDEAPSQRTLI